MSEPAMDLARTCFVVSPIGRDGTDVHASFRTVLDDLVRPAVESFAHSPPASRAE